MNLFSKLRGEASPLSRALERQLPQTVIFMLPRAGWQGLRVCSREDQEGRYEKSVRTKTAWDTSSTWVEGPPLLWPEVEHLPVAALGSS